MTRACVNDGSTIQKIEAFLKYLKHLETELVYWSIDTARVILPFLICRCNTCQCDFCQQTLDAFVIFSCVNIAVVYILPLYLKYHLTFCRCNFASVSQIFFLLILPCNLFLILSFFYTFGKIFKKSLTFDKKWLMNI